MTYVFIHGAGDSGAAFDLVAEHLRASGHDVVAPDLPCEDPAAGLAEYTDTVVDAIGDHDDVVVVAHSLGGLTAPLVAERVGADLLVLVSGMIPAPGETGNDWWGNTGAGDAYRAENAGRGESDDEIYFHDVPPDVVQRATALGRDQAGRPLEDPWPLAAWPDVETRFVLCRDDRCFPADWMRGVVRERLGIEPDEMDGGHCAYLSRPDELAALLEELRTTRRSRSARRAR